MTGTRATSRHGEDRSATAPMLVAGLEEPTNPRPESQRPFPLVSLEDGETPASHIERVARLIDEAIGTGAAHLRVPREAASWLEDHPALADYLASTFALHDTSLETGITFSLHPDREIELTLEAEGWRPLDMEGTRFVAPRKLNAPRLFLRPKSPSQGRLRGEITLACDGLRTLRIGFASVRPDRPNPAERQIVLRLERPGVLWHDLPFVEATFADGGEVRLDFDLKINGGRSLSEIVIELVEENNWRMHPCFEGGASFMLPATAPAGSKLALHQASLRWTEQTRRGPAFGHARGALPEPYRRPPEERRDAVIFSSWAPEAGLALGDYFIDVLRRWHGDSKIFVGINHGSSPEWRERLEASGLDVAIRHAPSTIAMAGDPAGFVAALDAFRRQSEEFNVVWFGHTKGAGHLDEAWYFTGRWTIERMFWSRRAEIAAHFADPAIGLYSPHYLMMLQAHLSQTDALQRVYQAICAPLGAMAVSTHFAMRGESVRAFCQSVDPRFFLDGPEPFGGDKFFFEMAMPNVPLMQGFEPFIEPGLGGTSGAPKPDGIASVLNDWRQNNAVVAIELEKWRQRPTRFRTRHREHNRHD